MPEHLPSLLKDQYKDMLRNTGELNLRWSHEKDQEDKFDDDY